MIAHPVGEKEANAFGLYDMQGNVTEWCEDCWHGNYSGHPGTGGVWADGDCAYRVIRGASYSFYGRSLRPSARVFRALAAEKDGGFRCSLDVP